MAREEGEATACGLANRAQVLSEEELEATGRLTFSSPLHLTLDLVFHFAHLVGKRESAESSETRTRYDQQDNLLQRQPPGE